MKNLILTFACCTMLQILAAQTTATWIGGTPGRPTEWNCATNWKENNIPDELSQVIIPADRQYYPILQRDAIEIDALLVTGGAKMTIQTNAFLTVLGESGRLNGLMIQGQVINEGRLIVENLEDEFSASAQRNISGQGSTIIAGSMASSRLAQK